jgi:2-polyprenyl-6-methoxyphenol hydroxylase-like FAD-dependent oxidoreductase
MGPPTEQNGGQVSLEPRDIPLSDSLDDDEELLTRQWQKTEDMAAEARGIAEVPDGECDVAIVGGSISGLAAALALKQVLPTLSVKVFDRSSEALLSSGPAKGGPSRIEPNGLKAAAAIDRKLHGTMLEKGMYARRVLLHDMDAGTVITRTRPEPMNAERGPHSSNAVVIGWSELHQLLLDRLPHDTVVYGATLASYKDEADCVRLEFQDGRSISAKVLLACDGPNSDVRAQCINDGEPLYDNAIRWVGRLPGDSVSTTPTDHEAWWVQPGQAFVSHPLKGGDVAWEALASANALKEAGWEFDPESRKLKQVAGSSTEADGDKSGDAAAYCGVQHEALEAAFSAFPTPVRYMLQHTADGVTLQSSVFIRTPDLPPTLGAGRVVLMGEAAHPLRPTGQEESQALEDAAELGACVMLFGVTKEALRKFELRRRPRWRHVMQVTMAQGTSSNVGVPLRQGLFNDYTSDLYNINFKPLVRKPHHNNMLKWLVGTGPWQRKMQRLLGTALLTAGAIVVGESAWDGLQQRRAAEGKSTGVGPVLQQLADAAHSVAETAQRVVVGGSGLKGEVDTDAPRYGEGEEKRVGFFRGVGNKVVGVAGKVGGRVTRPVVNLAKHRVGHTVAEKLGAF